MRLDPDRRSLVALLLGMTWFPPVARPYDNLHPEDVAAFRVIAGIGVDPCDGATRLGSEGRQGVDARTAVITNRCLRMTGGFGVPKRPS